MQRKRRLTDPLTHNKCAKREQFNITNYKGLDSLLTKPKVSIKEAVLTHWMLGAGALGQRDGMGREEGGGFRMGNTCIPVADSFRYWQNQYNIVKFKNKIKFKKKQCLNTQERLFLCEK